MNHIITYVFHIQIREILQNFGVDNSSRPVVLLRPLLLLLMPRLLLALPMPSLLILLPLTRPLFPLYTNIFCPLSHCFAIVVIMLTHVTTSPPMFLLRPLLLLLMSRPLLALPMLSLFILLPLTRPLFPLYTNVFCPLSQFFHCFATVVIMLKHVRHPSGVCCRSNKSHYAHVNVNVNVKKSCKNRFR